MKQERERGWAMASCPLRLYFTGMNLSHILSACWPSKSRSPASGNRSLTPESFSCLTRILLKMQSRRGSVPNPRSNSPCFLLLSHVLCKGPSIFSLPNDPSGINLSLCFLRLISLLYHCPMADTACGLFFLPPYRKCIPKGASRRVPSGCARRGWMQPHYGLTVCMKKKGLTKHFPFISQPNGLARAAGLYPVNSIVFKRISLGLDHNSMGCTQALLCLCG